MHLSAKGIQFVDKIKSSRKKEKLQVLRDVCATTITLTKKVTQNIKWNAASNNDKILCSNNMLEEQQLVVASSLAEGVNQLDGLRKY